MDASMWKPIDLATALRALVAHAQAHPEDGGRLLAALGEIAAELSPGAVVKRCSCGGEYDRARWDELEVVGPQDDGVLVSELRNCRACQSTIGVAVALSPDLAPAVPGGGSEVACARLVPTAETAASPAADPPLCEAPGCGVRLSQGQVARGARACSAACRRAAHRARQRDRRLAALDAAATALAEARAEIERA